MPNQAIAQMKFPSLITTPIIVVSVLFPILSFIAIFYRWKARRTSRQPLHGDDWWIVATWFLSLGISINFWVFADIVGINDIKGDPVKGTMNSLKCILIASCILQWPLAAVKISILLFYKRIFSTQKFGWCVWAAIGLVSSWCIIFFFLVLFEGNPIGNSWGEPGYQRWDSPALGLAQVGTSIALDFFVLCFPIPVISRLHLQTKRKAAVALIFWLGSFCVIAAVVRLVFLKQSIEKVYENKNAVHVQSKNCIFMVLEPHCSIIAACLPCYGPLFRGGRSQQSLVASVRSIFSLRSQGSGSGGSGRNAYAQFGDSSKRPSGSNSATESQIELKNGSNLQGQGHGQSKVVIERLSHGSDEEAVIDNGINVTRAVEVIRK